MIQRIQTVYLLIVVGLLITAMCLPMGYFIDAMGEHPFKALGLEVNGAIQSTWGLFGILMVSTHRGCGYYLFCIRTECCRFV